MIAIQVLKNKPAVFRCFTGMNLVAFQKLLPAFERAYKADWDRRDQERSAKRRRERGGGRNSVLKGLEDKLLLILFYFKIYPLQEVQGYLFGMYHDGVTIPIRLKKLTKGIT